MRLFIRIRARHPDIAAPAGAPKYREPQFLLRRPSRLREFPENLAILLRPSAARPWPGARFSLLPAKAVERQSALGSVLVHTCVVAVLFSIPWLFPKHVPTAAEIAAEHRRRISWYYFSDELPHVTPSEKASTEPKTADEAKADKPRFDRNLGQLIESHQPNPDNDRQTIIQPDAPNIRLKEDVAVPNIVMWAGAKPPSMEYLDAPNVDMARRQLPVPDMPQPRPQASLDYLPAPQVDLSHNKLNVPNVSRPQQQASLDYLPAPQVDVNQRQLNAPNIGASRQQATLEYIPAPQVNLKGRALDVPNIARSQQQATLEYIPAPQVDVSSGRLRTPNVAGTRVAPAMDYLPAAPEVRTGAAGGVPSVVAAGRPEKPSLDYIAAPNVAMTARAPASLPGGMPQVPERAYLPAAEARVGSSAAPLVPLGNNMPAGPAKTEKNIVALSVNPAPASGPITLPAGNRAGDFTVTTAPNGSGASGGVAARANGDGGALHIPGISISGGSRPPAAAAGTPVVSGPVSPPAPLPEPPVPPSRTKPAPAEVAAALARYSRPQRGLPDWKDRAPANDPLRHTVKRIYTAYISMPNMTSAAGSWVLKFAELVDRTPGDQIDLTPPVAVRKVDPVYDPDLMRDKIEGTVTLAAIIRQDGSVDAVRVLRGLNARLDSNAVEALQRWKFQPATRAGVPVDLEATVQIPFLAMRPEDKKH